MTQLNTGLNAELESILDKFLTDNTQPTFIFRLIDAGEHTLPVQSAQGVENMVYNPSRCAPGATKIRTADGRQIRVMYSESQDEKMVNGVMTLTDRPSAIWFDHRTHCIVTVSRNNRELLTRLIFSDECRNSINPYKEDPLGGVMYELIEPEKKAKVLAATKQRIGAAIAALGTASDTELAIACTRLELPSTADKNANYSTLFDAANLNPEAVFNALSDEYDKVTALVRDLTTQGIVEFDAAARKYITLPARTDLLDVPQGNHEPVLIKYLSVNAQGQKVKVTLQRMLDEKNAKKGGKR